MSLRVTEGNVAISIFYLKRDSIGASLLSITEEQEIHFTLV